MAFSDHKIAAFAHKITDLPDQPNLPADELKARFDSSPEELRQAHNALCDDAATLSGKVDSILAETFDGVVEKSMLSDELQDEIDAKAVETSVASRFTAEQTAREAADSALSTRVTTLESTVPSKVEVYAGSYTGNGSDSRTVYLGFQPRAVILCGWGGGQTQLIAAQGISVNTITLTATGFTLNSCDMYDSNKSTSPYAYLAFR